MAKQGATAVQYYRLQLFNHNIAYVPITYIVCNFTITSGKGTVGVLFFLSFVKVVRGAFLEGETLLFSNFCGI